MSQRRTRAHIGTYTPISFADEAAMTIPWMHGCEVIVRESGDWHEDLGRGRTLQRTRPRRYRGIWVPDAAPQAKRYDSLMELCELANMAHAKLEDAERNSDSMGGESSTASPGDNAPVSSAAQPSPVEHSVDTPPTVNSIPEHYEPGMGYAGWKEFSGRSRAPSPWVPGYWGDHPAGPSSVRRFVRRVRDSYRASTLGRAVSRGGRFAKELRGRFSAKQ